MLHCYEINGTDTVIAESTEDAWTVWCKHSGERREDYSDGTCEQVPDENNISIGMSAFDWANYINRKEFLCSTEK